MQSLLYLALGLSLFLVGIWAFVLHLRSARARTSQRRSIAALHDLASKMVRDVNEFDGKVKTISTDLDDGKSNLGADEVLVAVEQISRASDAMRTKLKDSEEKLRQQSAILEDHALAARTDASTELPNQVGLELELERRLASLREGAEATSLLTIELVDFDRLVASHGPAASEAYLRAVAKAISVGDTDDFFAARTGAAAFAVVFHGWDVDRARHRAERIRSRIDSLRVEHEGVVLQATACAGLAEDGRTDSPADWQRRANACLEEAKRRGPSVGVRMRSGALLSFDEAPPQLPPQVRTALKPSVVVDESRDSVTGLPNRTSFLYD